MLYCCYLRHRFHLRLILSIAPRFEEMIIGDTQTRNLFWIHSIRSIAYINPNLISALMKQKKKLKICIIQVRVAALAIVHVKRTLNESGMNNKLHCTTFYYPIAIIYSLINSNP